MHIRDQCRGNCGFLSQFREKNFAKAPFEIGGIAVRETGEAGSLARAAISTVVMLKSKTGLRGSLPPIR